MRKTFNFVFFSSLWTAQANTTWSNLQEHYGVLKVHMSHDILQVVDNIKE